MKGDHDYDDDHEHEMRFVVSWRTAGVRFAEVLRLGAGLL